MKKVINGRVYDTETAEKIVTTVRYEGTSEQIRETLFRKKVGDFFLFGQGEKDSKYATLNENDEWVAGEKIIPISFADAKAWGKGNLPEKKFETIFVSEAGLANHVFTMSLKEVVYGHAKAMAAEDSQTLSGYIADLVENDWHRRREAREAEEAEE